MLKVFLADTSVLIREGIKTILQKESLFDVVAESDDPSEILKMIKRIEFDVLMIDYNCFPADFIGVLVENGLQEKLLCITTKTEKSILEKVIAAGINTHIFKDCDKNEIVDAVKATAANEKFYCGKVLNALSVKGELDQNFSCHPINISTRETEIIKFIAEGLTNKEIAERLCLSNHTVMTHRKNIMSKLRVNNTAGVVMYAIKENLIGIQ